MTKTQNTTNDAAANLTIGQLVEIDVTKDGETSTATGTLSGTNKGWYVVELDEDSAEEQGRDRISVRAASIRAADDEQAEQAYDDFPDGTDVAEMDAEEGIDDEGEGEGETVSSKMAEALRKARVRYVKDKRPSGAATAHNGDVIARELRDYEPKEVCGLCDRCFDLPKGSTFAKYEHLNNGQQRMNAGNRIRSAYAKGGDAIRARIAQVLGLDEVEQEAAE